ncbi:MAG: methyltransferase domain-containing protein [bacterium]|nr:methyltransferase domain-containing protein [bacterium]
MLHLGAGAYTHTGWIGSDILPGSKQIVWLDATKAFPIDSQSFDYILCEHMIEHIPWESALNMLTECHRVLRPGGVVRIATQTFQYCSICTINHQLPPAKTI